MTTDPNAPVLLASARNEVEAAAICSALAAYGIQASATGGYTSGFKAEAPGEVKVMVKHGDLERAAQALKEIRQEQGKIDWSDVDVGEPDE